MIIKSYDLSTGNSGIATTLVKKLGKDKHLIISCIMIHKYTESNSTTEGSIELLNYSFEKLEKEKEYLEKTCPELIKKDIKKLFEREVFEQVKKIEHKTKSKTNKRFHRKIRKEWSGRNFKKIKNSNFKKG